MSISFQNVVDYVNKGNSTIPKIPSLPGVERVTASGILTLQVTASVLAVSTIIFMFSAMRQPKNLRLFHYITASITMIAALAYFIMSQGIGAAFIEVPGKDHAMREVFYARYLDWFLTTPLLLLDLALLAGIPPVDIVLLIVADVGMIGTGLIAALNEAAPIKWGLYFISNLFFVYVLYGLIITGRKSANIRGDGVATVYGGLAALTVISWAAYPVVWFFSEGTNILHADTEVIVYAGLDIIAKSVFGFILLSSHSSMGEAHQPLPESWVSSQPSYGAVSSTARD